MSDYVTVFLVLLIYLVVPVVIGLLLLRMFDVLKDRWPFSLKINIRLSIREQKLLRQARQLIVQNKRLIGASLFLSVLITAVSYFSAGGSLGPVIYKSQTGRGFPFAYLVTTPSKVAYYLREPTTALLWSYLLLDLVIWFIVSIILLMGTKRLLLSYLREK